MAPKRKAAAEKPDVVPVALKIKRSRVKSKSRAANESSNRSVHTVRVFNKADIHNHTGFIRAVLAVPLPPLPKSI